MVKGTYILLFRITKSYSGRVGSLGSVEFKRGNYAYVGSAQSSLIPRLERHYARKKRLHWHIDYLTSSRISRIKGAIYAVTDRKELECLLSGKLSERPFSRAVPHFGSSDCKHGCKSHLFRLNASWKDSTSSIILIYKKMDLQPLAYQHR